VFPSRIHSGQPMSTRMLEMVSHCCPLQSPKGADPPSGSNAHRVRVGDPSTCCYP
jgi:hypothetical protein